MGYNPLGCKELDMTKDPARAHTHTHTHTHTSLGFLTIQSLKASGFKIRKWGQIFVHTSTFTLILVPNA